MDEVHMNRVDAVITAYSLILLIGGVTGYMLAGSTASLLMSATFAILLIGTLFLSRFYPAFAQKTTYTLLSALILFFGYRWYSIKFMPSGLLCLLTLSVLTTVFLLTYEKKA